MITSAPHSIGPHDTDRKRWLQRWAALESARSSAMTQWREITDVILPFHGRYFLEDREKNRVNKTLYDNTATRALRVMAAGMMAGATSPARPWFRLSMADPELSEAHAVKEYLADVTRRMQTVFSRSNTYRALHQVYEELGAFGTAVTIIQPSFEKVIHHYPVTTGEYCIAADYQGRVSTLYRRFQTTVAEMVKEFGFERCSEDVQQQYRNGNLEALREIMHVIEPRADRDTRKRDARNMPWRSCYLEIAGRGDDATLLRESGFEQFPALVPRWSVTGGDVYGNGPGHECIGDVKQLQLQQWCKAKAIHHMADPALQVPTALSRREVDALPGGITFVDQASPQGGVRQLWESKPQIDHLLLDIQDVRERIRSSFFADLFLMLATAGPDQRMTATEVAERHEEKLLMLGPVLERLHTELLEPLIEQTFVRMAAVGALPPPPEEMQGADVNVEFVSMLAQAQRAVATTSIDRFTGNLGAVAQFKPEVLDKFDADAWADAYSDMLGVDPKLIVPTQEVVLIRQRRAQAEAALKQSEMLQQQAAAARDLSQAQVGTGSALDVIGQFSGYSTPSPAQV